MMSRQRLGVTKYFWNLSEVSKNIVTRMSEFQSQLEASLTGVPFLLAILTPAPSGPDEIRSTLSYTETVRRYAQEGWTDYCHVELSKALVRQILQSSRDTHLLTRLSLPLLLCGDIVVLLLDLRLTRQRR